MASSLKIPSALLLVLLVLAGFVVGCGEKKTGVRDLDAVDPTVDTDIKTGVKPQPDNQVAVIETEYGNLVLELYPNIALHMVERFKRLVQEKFYDGTTFHRIELEGGLIQGGDPLSKDNDPDNDGQGNSPYPNLTAEFSDIPFQRGTVGAARWGGGDKPGLTEAAARDTGNCQFFITLKDMPALDEDYTVFGKVIQGINNADIIAGAPVEEGTNRPADKIAIKNITLQPRAQFVSGQSH